MKSRRKDIERRIADGEVARKQWRDSHSRQEHVGDSPFTVSVVLNIEQPDWADVQVFYSGRWCAGTTAEFSVPIVALVRAAELAQELSSKAEG